MYEKFPMHFEWAYQDALLLGVRHQLFYHKNSVVIAPTFAPSRHRVQHTTGQESKALVPVLPS